MLADYIGYALGLHLAGRTLLTPIFFWSSTLFRRMEFCVADLMDHGLDGLHLAHIRLHQNAPLCKIAAAKGSAGKGFNADGIG